MGRNFVVFDADTTVPVTTCRLYHNAIQSAAAMKRAHPKRDYVVYHQEFYQNYVRYQRTVKNLMSGKPVVEWSDTPLSCSVASETYWSA